MNLILFSEFRKKYRESILILLLLEISKHCILFLYFLCCHGSNHIGLADCCEWGQSSLCWLFVWQKKRYFSLWLQCDHRFCWFRLWANVSSCIWYFSNWWGDPVRFCLQGFVWGKAYWGRGLAKKSKLLALLFFLPHWDLRPQSLVAIKRRLTGQVSGGLTSYSNSLILSNPLLSAQENGSVCLSCPFWCLIRVNKAVLITV